MDRWRKRDGIFSQHGGAAGSDTAWLSVVPTALPLWLAEFGGTLSSGARVLSRLTGYAI